jgi:seryl-tRNA synthetase
MQTLSSNPSTTKKKKKKKNVDSNSVCNHRRLKITCVTINSRTDKLSHLCSEMSTAMKMNKLYTKSMVRRES